MSLKERILRTGVAIGIGLGSLFYGGCESMKESDFTALGIAGHAMGAKTPQQAQAGYYLSEFARESGRRQHEKGVAREGRSETRIYIIYQNGQPVNVIDNDNHSPENKEPHIIYQDGQPVNVIP